MAHGKTARMNPLAIILKGEIVPAGGPLVFRSWRPKPAQLPSYPLQDKPFTTEWALFNSTLDFPLLSSSFASSSFLYHKLKVFTAYEFLEQRFDQRTRTLTAILFLVQRGLAAGITIYAPAIILSVVLGWPLKPLIFLIGLVVIFYTVIGEQLRSM